MGNGAYATNDNTFVWSDGTAIGSTTNKQVSIYASNGYRLLGGPITGNGSGLTGTGTTFTAGNALAGWPTTWPQYLVTNGISIVQTTNSAGVASVSGGQISIGTNQTAAAGGATSGYWTNIATVAVTNTLSTGGTIALPSNVQMLRIFGTYNNTNTPSMANVALFVRYNGDTNAIYDERLSYLGGVVSSANQSYATLATQFGTKDNAGRSQQFDASVQINLAVYPTLVSAYACNSQGSSPPIDRLNVANSYRSTATVTSVVWGVTAGAATNTLFYIQGWVP
jgi:hypothetical protein